MTAFIIRRLCQSLVILALTSLIVFAGVYAIGDPIEILVPADATQAEIAQAVQSLGLDLPLYQQYLKFVGNALHGDLGNSFVFNQPAIQLILQRLPATLELACVELPNKKTAGNLQLAGSYDFEWIKLHGTYGNLRNANTGPSAGYDRVNSYIAGVSVPTGKVGTLMASYQRATGSDITGWALGYQYDLSRHTNLYAYVNRLDIRESHTLQTSVGIRHMF